MERLAVPSPRRAPGYVRALKALLGRDQPDGLYLLFSVEMWERFSYYGMRALLVLYLTSTAGGLGWSKQSASTLYGVYTSLVYLTPLLGGYLADRTLGTHRAMVIGASVITLGHFTLAVPLPWTFYLGLALIIIGTGFFKSNVSTMVGQLYGEGDRRRDAGFTVFYMGINMGAFLGQIACGYLAKGTALGWHGGFGAAGVGMTLGLIAYLRNKRAVLGDIGDLPARRERDAPPARPRSADAARSPTGEVDAPARLTRPERERTAAVFVLAFFNVFFWLAFEQAGSSMNFFADERTDRMIGGFEIPAPWFQSINPLIIILCAPLFARLWLVLGRLGREPSTPVKMAIGLWLLGLGFVFMVLGARASDGGQLVSPGWLVGAYAFHTFGELCLSPVGLSMVTKLAPARFASLLMGVWLLASFFANLVGGLVAGTVEKVERGEYFRLLGGQADFFLLFVASSGLAGALLFALAPVMRRLMHGRG